MKNLINEKPQVKLTGRFRKSIKFVDKNDISKKILLDVGCGYGWFVHHAFKRGAKKVAGIELTQEDLKTVNKYIDNKQFITKVGSAIGIPFKDSTFNTVVAWEVIEHIPLNTENKFFAEVHRVLKKDGIFYISTPFDSMASKFLDPAYWLIGHRHYSKQKLSKFGEDNKFIVEKIVVAGKWWSIFALLNMYISKWIFRRESFKNDFFLQKEDNEYMSPKEGFHDIFVKYKKVTN